MQINCEGPDKEGKLILYKMNLNSFVSANNDDYNIIENFIDKFEKDVRVVR